MKFPSPGNDFSIGMVNGTVVVCGGGPINSNIAYDSCYDYTPAKWWKQIGYYPKSLYVQDDSLMCSSLTIPA